MSILARKVVHDDSFIQFLEAMETVEDAGGIGPHDHLMVKVANQPPLRVKAVVVEKHDGADDNRTLWLEAAE